MTVILRTEDLTKRYGKLVAVNRLNLEVHEGDLYGFLGLNGAGKTTTIRMTLGLIRPTAGRVVLFGMEARKHFLDVMGRIGALVEQPVFYNYLSGAQNLEVLRLASSPSVSRRRIDEVLGLVGLSDRAGDKVRTYSQGMRQRLGIAQALLSEPQFVILDEPTNGLDPQGINDIRALLVKLNRTRGMTFLISSHLLHEIEQTCTRVGMIHRGMLVVQERVEKLLQENQGRVRLRAHLKDKAKEVLRQIPYVHEVAEEADGTLQLKLEAHPELEQRMASLNTALVQNGVDVGEITLLRLSLEEFFLSRSGESEKK